ncbi:BZIP transcription factor family protein [Striga asiatica]|uniref:BZIP transcription factor family protein n=1 Tax=Striga asiatica TaxID=4170 RepID=A0A5A7R4F8_STRAF|nr:BZIP transcription factor family protein [Striga asiatica]
MAEPAAVAVDPQPPPHSPPCPTGEFDPCLHNPPLDADFFDENLLIAGGGVLEGLDFDFSFDDFCLPTSDDLDILLEPMRQPDSQSGSDPHDSAQFSPNFDRFHSVFKSASRELSHLHEDGDFHGDRSWEGSGPSGVLSSSSPEMESQQISAYLNMPSPESNGSNRASAENCSGAADEKVLKCNSPEYEGSGDFASNVSADNSPTRSVSCSPDSSNCSIKTGVVDQKIKLEEPANANCTISSLKRKIDSEDLSNTNNNIEFRTNKYRKSSCSVENNNTSDNSNGVFSEDEEKRKARLLRNRESAQLSRQRKKHYVEELEEKVRAMHSTIQDLNGKITYFMAENATLRQQMGCGVGAVAGAPAAPLPPGAYPHHPAMMYPWMPCSPPPFMVKPQGSQVPLVPIPRLKTKLQPAKPSKKSSESRKNEGPKTKKVASVSFLGLLFFIMLFGGLLPIFNVRYGGFREVFTSGDGYMRYRGRVLTVNGTEYGEKSGGDEFVPSGNGSQSLAASLYVPRNDRMVKIDGNLIIHSVLASEKAMASSNGKGGSETGLVVPRDLGSSRSVNGVGINGGARHVQLRALGSGSGDEDGGVKSSASDGSLQQWFREGLAGPMLSSGVCTEVFQFDVSAAGAIIPASPNISKVETPQNSTNKARNRRILHPKPPYPNNNISTQQPRTNANPEQENLDRNKSTSSMVVSVLFDPRESGDADVDGVMGTKSLSRIFVVVLIDSVKYVTYSCMLPFAGSGPHLVTT